MWSEHLLQSKHCAIIVGGKRGFRHEIQHPFSIKDPREGKKLAPDHKVGRGRGQTGPRINGLLSKCISPYFCGFLTSFYKLPQSRGQKSLSLKQTNKKAQGTQNDACIKTLETAWFRIVDLGLKTSKVTFTTEPMQVARTVVIKMVKLLDRKEQ